MLELTIESMTCGHCASVVTKAVKALDPLAKVEVDVSGHKVRVETTEARQAVVEALTEAGYPPG